ncbi:ATP synthase subunit B [Erythrobacter sp. NAP1]|uniref:hypothetical protein n=1 Tax=Erythrobacter sp. NAP1 TaxID=237727 RepID=UPI0000686C85|nr:hypothetical protein [Erythrobacter sp. NAP1]EAQ30729.1 ATP synthase subunit B [Erythrobacter sp. NAP1]
MKTLKTFVACTVILGLAACAAPAEEEGAGDDVDVATVSTANDDTVGDAGDPPSMETVSMALGEACTGFGTEVRSATCVATDLAQSFTCDFALASDPEGVTRELTLTQSDDAWAVEQEPQFCSSLERADAMADQPASANVPTQPE